jgi:hypothetical protein
MGVNKLRTVFQGSKEFYIEPRERKRVLVTFEGLYKQKAMVQNWVGSFKLFKDNIIYNFFMMGICIFNVKRK